MSRSKSALALACVLALTACESAVRREAASRARPHAFMTAAEIVPRARPFDVDHYALSIALDPVARSIDADCAVRFVATEDRVARVELDLEGFTVSRVLDGEGRELRFARDGGVLAIDLAAPLARGELAEVRVAYSGTPRKGLFFAGDRGGVPTQVFTHAEPQDARAWFPCLDEPHERATSEIAVSMPLGWTSIAAGERIERREEGAVAIERWRMHVPHPAYLETLVAGDLALVESSWDGIPIVFASSRELGPLLERTLAATGDVLAFFSETTGARYPYAKYATACVDGLAFGGMENVSATTIVETALVDERGARDGDATGLVAHEAAHQWFGDLATCATWSETWLNEGFATYLTALYTEHARGADALDLEMRANLDGYLAGDVAGKRRPIVWGVAREPLELFAGGAVYQGGAGRLHLLRSKLGDAAFFAGLRRYVGENRGRAVTTADFQHAMERASGADLRAFFDQWLRAPGVPELSVRTRWHDGALDVAIEQVQDPRAGMPSVFAFPLEIEVAGAEGARVVRVEVDERRETYRIDAASEPAWVRVDPRGIVPKRMSEDRSRESWLAIARSCERALGRREAALVLAREAANDAGDWARDALRERLQRDSCAEVRRIAAEALGKRAEAESLEPLMAAAAGDDAAPVRVAGLRALEGFGPRSEIASLARRAFEEAFSWGTRSAAAALLARADPDLGFDWLARRLREPSPHDAWAARAIVELARLDEARVAPIARELASDDSARDPARAAALSVLETCSRERDVARELAVRLLDSPRPRVRRAALSVLAKNGDPSVRSPLESFAAATVHASERRAAEDVLRALDAPARTAE